MFRLYAPALVLLVWALPVELFGITRELGAVALLTLAAATVVQVHETRARYRHRHSRGCRGRS